MKRPFLVIFLLAFVAIAWLYLVTAGDHAPVPDTPSDVASPLRFEPDAGLIINYAEAGEAPEDFVGERVVYEAYRLLLPESLCDDSVDACEIDLRQEDVRAFVTRPDGTEDEIGHEYFYYLIPVFPFNESGNYAFRVETADGESAAGTLTFSAVAGSVSIVPEEATGDQSAIVFNDVDTSGADSILHILPSNLVRDLTRTSEGTIVAHNDDLAQEGGHVFLMKTEDVWRYAVHFTPETE